jgi:hypothetical protein
MKQYKYDEWDIEPGISFDDRTYIDMEGNRITGMLEGFYGYTNNQDDEKNSQYVKNGKRCQKPQS